MGRKKSKDRDEWIVKLQDEFYTHRDDKRKWKDMRQYTNSYKKMKHEIAGLRSETVVLSRTEQVRTASNGAVIYT